MEQYKQINTEENYNKLLNSGMFWEFHPELTGKWEVDEKLILPDVGCTFFCEDEDLGYQTEKCAKQCDGCSWIEKRVAK